MTEILKKEGNKVYFDILVPAEEIKKAEESVYAKNKSYFNIPGFRKGKAPKKIVENVYGKDVFFEDAINEVLPKIYEETIKEMDLEVIDYPNVDIEEYTHGEDVKVNVNVEVKPDVKLGKYKELEIGEVSSEVTEEFLDNELDNQRQLNARKINVDDRAAQIGDVVNIDFEGFVDGEAFEGGKAENQDLELGSNTFIPGFEDQIVDKNTGDEFDVTVTFPEEYGVEDLQGKEAVFKVTLNSIAYEELPELDDEFIKDISEFDTVDEYKADLKASKEEEFKTSAKNKMQEAALEAVVEDMEVEVPDVMVENAIDSQIQNFDNSLKAQGLGIDAYLNMLGTDLPSFRETMREDAAKSVKIQLALEAIVKEENLDVTDEEIKEEAKVVAEKYFGDDEEKINEMIDVMFQGDQERIREDLKTRKAIDLIMESAIIK